MARPRPTHPPPRILICMAVPPSGEEGSIMVIFALLLTVLVGMIALGVEAGSWYVVRAELSKAVDAAALAGAKNISNPNVDPAEIAREIGQANFSAGYAGTQAAGAGAASFNAVFDRGSSAVSVTGTASGVGLLSGIFGIGTMTVSSAGAARKGNVDIMLVLDRSASMGWSNGRGGTKLDDLKSAALDFISFFKDTQQKDRMGLVSFALNVTVDFPLGYDFYSGITGAINGMSANDMTNLEDGLAQSVQAKGLQPDRQRKQFVILFTDGVPNAFRGNFYRNGTEYDGVVRCDDNICGTDILPTLFDPVTAADTGVPATPTGDGTNGTTRWDVFNAYPLLGRSLGAYVGGTSRDLAMQHATEIKQSGVTIYVVGLGMEGAPDYDRDLLVSLSSGEKDFYYNTPDSEQLSSIFQAIAKDISLRLVQ